MWIDAPTAVSDRDFVPLLRPKAGHHVVAFLLDRPLRLFTHFFCKRTWPCVAPKCPCCARKIGKRLDSYYPAATLRGNPAVIELTPVSEHALQRLMLEHTDSASGVIRLTRPTGRKNLPCEVAWRPIGPADPPCKLPPDPDFLVKTLCRMWKVDCPPGDYTSAEWIDELRENLVLALANLEGKT
jgi:hypothetical protein